MSRATVLARGQAAALASMTDTCTIRRVTGESTDAASGVITPTYSTLYTGACRVQQRTVTTTPQDAGEARAQMLQLEVQLPLSVTGLRTEDQITVTASGDADLVNRVFLIRGLAHKTEATARRVMCEERTS
jgi:hypothetical protein